MGQYARTSPSTGTVITAAYLDGEFAKIETAHNTHTTGDFPANSVPQTALVNGQSYFAMHLRYYAQIPINQTATKYAQVVVPVNCTLVKVKAVVMAVTATASVDVYDEGAGPAATVLSSPITIAAATTAYSRTVGTAFLEDDILSLRATTNGTGLLDGTEVTLLFKANHVA